MPRRGGLEQAVASRKLTWWSCTGEQHASALVTASIQYVFNLTILAVIDRRSGSQKSVRHLQIRSSDCRG